MPNPPRIVILAGPNGAGKSTLAPNLLAAYGISEFVNADTIARGLSAFDPESAAFEAGRVMLRRIRELAADRRDFAFESTLASRTFAPWLRSLVEGDYRVHVYYVWLPRAEMCIRRVGARVRSGGHFVPDDDVRRRYERSMRNFWSLYRPLAERWAVFENASGDRPRLFARGCKMKTVEAVDHTLWESFSHAAQIPK